MSPQDFKLLQARQLGFLSDLFPTPSTTDSTSGALSSTSSTLSTTTSSTTSTSTFSSSTSTTTSVPVIVTTVTGHTTTLTAPPEGQTSMGPSTSFTPFLQNKVLSGLVFGLAGLVGLTMLIATITCVIRRRRIKRLFDEAVDFDPTARADYLESRTMEKLNFSSSIGHKTDARPYPIPHMYHTKAPNGQFQSPPIQQY